MSSLQKIVKKAKNFPNKPGIYWFSKNGKRIYVGKAGSLKKRIASYFRTSDSRIKMMVNEADNISFKKTNSVLEAVILEANAIKKYLPKYNIKEKDDRSFVYLIISKDKFPKIFIARGREVEKYLMKNYNWQRGKSENVDFHFDLANQLYRAKRRYIFGPYQSYKVLKTALNLARKIFPFGTCRPMGDLSKGDKPNQDKPCFDYQIGLCPGICIGAISNKDYKKNIKNLILFFKGEHKRLIKKLKKPARIATPARIAMRSIAGGQSVAGGENPEKVFSLQHINDVALINSSNFGISDLGFGISAKRIEGYDISHLSGSNPVGAMVIFTGGMPDKSQYRLFKIKNTENKFDDLAMLREVLERRFKHKEWRKPDIIVVDGGKNQVKITKKIMTNFNITIPIVGIIKILGHSGQAAEGDKFIFENTKPSVKKLLLSSRQLFQQVRNEAHRFAIAFQRKQRDIKKPKSNF